MEGYLAFKKGVLRFRKAEMKKLYFVFTHTPTSAEFRYVLSWYKDATKSKQKGSINLASSLSIVTEQHRQLFLGYYFSLTLSESKEIYHFSAETKDSLELWLAHFREAMQRDVYAAVTKANKFIKEQSVINIRLSYSGISYTHPLTEAEIMSWKLSQIVSFVFDETEFSFVVCSKCSKCSGRFSHQVTLQTSILIVGTLVERISALYSDSHLYYTAIMPEKTISGDIYKTPHKCAKPLGYRQEDSISINSPLSSPVRHFGTQYSSATYRQYAFPYHSNSNSAHNTPTSKRRELIQQTIYERSSPPNTRIYNSPLPYMDPPSIKYDYQSPLINKVTTNALTQSLQVKRFNSLPTTEQQTFQRHKENKIFPHSPSFNNEKSLQPKSRQDFVKHNSLSRHPKHYNELFSKSYCAQESFVSEIKWPDSYLAKNRTLSDRESYRYAPKATTPQKCDIWTPTRHGGYKWTPVSSATGSIYSDPNSQCSYSTNTHTADSPATDNRSYNTKQAYTTDDMQPRQTNARHHSDTTQTELQEDLVPIDKDGYAEITTRNRDEWCRSRSLPRNIKCFSSLLVQQNSPLHQSTTTTGTNKCMSPVTEVRNKIFRFPLNDVPCHLKKPPGGETAGRIIVGRSEYKIPRLGEYDENGSFSKSLNMDRAAPPPTRIHPDSSDATTSSSDYYEIMTNLAQLRPKTKHVKHTRALGHENRSYDKNSSAISKRASNISSSSTVSTTSSSDVCGQMEERLATIKSNVSLL